MLISSSVFMNSLFCRLFSFGQAARNMRKKITIKHNYFCIISTELLISGNDRQKLCHVAV